MAKGQIQGFGSVTVWMIVFVGLWLTSTVLLVIMYTGQEELRTNYTRAKDDNSRLISSSERSSVSLFQSASKAGPTLVGLVEAARSETAGLATGKPSDDAAAVGIKLEELLRTIRDDGIAAQAQSYRDISYHEALAMLYETYGSVEATRRDAEQRVSELEAEVDRLVANDTQQKDNFDKRAKELGDQLADSETSRAQYGSARDEEVAGLRREFEERRQQADADLTAERQANAALRHKNVQLQGRVGDLQRKFGGLLTKPQTLTTARQPDGRILTAIPGDELVYISLGRKHRLVSGLRFAVYNADSGIPVDGRAKAQIEVVSIEHDDSAACKISSICRGEVIMPGDLIANPIYDSDRAVSFAVLGEFDLDHDGMADRGGAAAVESMILNWGGSLSTELTALTDFVVLGGPPRRPRRVTTGSPEVAQRARLMQEARDRYLDAVADARTLAVPVLTQDVFLNFLGYAGRRATR